ncbi:MalY/PatB family protein [Brassicibacter mesophilus]|uniref:MalY/PatB family protein n=1 Tax=Brassicibacter mesophilus TaxID=745119 RepID=UPI003D204EAF
MKYNFDQIIDRWNTHSEKWDGMLEHYGTNDLLPMWEADMDFEVAPALKEAMIRRAQHGIYGYTVRENSFFDSIINWQKRRNGWTIQKDWIRNSSGAIPAVSVAVNAFTKPGDKVIIQDPVYYRFHNSVTLNGRHIVNNTMLYEDGEYKIDFDTLERQIDSRVKMIIICNPQNPVGKVFKKEELIRIGEICLKNNIIILSDEIYSDVVFTGNKHIPIASLSKELEMCTVTIFGPGKGFNLSGLKPTIIAIPNPRLREEYDFVSDAMQILLKNLFSIEAIEVAYNECEDWLDEAIKYLEANRNFMIDYFEKNIPQVKLIKPEGTYIAWLDFNGLGLNDKELEQLAIEKMKIGFKYGYTFGNGGQGFQRINFACPREMLLDGLQRIERAVKSL